MAEKCAGFNSTVNVSQETAYKCPGHRGNITTGENRKSSFVEYEHGDHIKAVQIDSIIKSLQDEVTARTQHVLYKDAEQIDLSVNPGDIIDHRQQNEVCDIIKRLNKLVNDSSDFGDTSLGEKSTSISSVPSGSIANSDDIHDFHDVLANLVNATMDDCICYSDCTEYFVPPSCTSNRKCRSVGYCSCVYY